MLVKILLPILDEWVDLNLKRNARILLIDWRAMSDDLTIFSKVQNIISDIDPQDILRDARAYGLNVWSVEDLINQSHNYVFIERLMKKYATLAATYSAASGLTSGIGGAVTAVTLAGVDIANMAAQLYRLNQRMAVLNGFNPENKIHQEKSQIIYLKALGFDAAAQAVIRTQVLKAVAEKVTKTGPSANVVVRLIMEAAKLLGVKLSKKQAVKIVPVVGAVVGGGMNYLFAKNAAENMISEYKSDYFDRWQASSR